MTAGRQGPEIAALTWHGTLGAEARACCHALLPAEDIAETRRFRTDDRRTQALASRALLRAMLARRLGGEPQAFRFERDAYQRPHLAGGAPELDFNISHTDGAVVCALGSAAIGVDIEREDAAPRISSVLHMVCGADELRELQGLPPDDSAKAMLASWTLKEAYAKALGLGMTLPFDQIRFEVSGGRATLVDTPFSAAGWAFQRLQLPVGYTVALAVQDAALAGPSPIEDGHGVLKAMAG